MYMHTRTETLAHSRFTKDTTTLAQWTVSIITCTHVHTQLYTYKMHTCTCTHTHILSYTCTHTHTALGLQGKPPHRHSGQ